MSRETTLVTKLEDLGRLLAALANNAVELPHLEPIRLQLEQLLNATLAAAQEHAALTALIASRQDVRQRLLRLSGDTQRVATAVRKLLKAHLASTRRSSPNSASSLSPAPAAAPERDAPHRRPRCRTMPALISEIQPGSTPRACSLFCPFSAPYVKRGAPPKTR